MLVDTNVLLDLVTADPVWSTWSLQQLDRAALAGVPLFINDVVYAELSIRFARIETLDAWLSQVKLPLQPAPRSALFLAGKAFQKYRAAGGVRGGVLPDFFIGAHASVAGVTLLTRDARRYRTYFPSLTVLSP